MKRKYKENYVPWNKGLTKETDPRVAKNGQGTSRGKKGKPLSEEHKKNLSESCKNSEQIQEHILDLNKNFHVGRKRSLETRQKQSDNSFQKGRSMEEAYGLEHATAIKNAIREARVNQVMTVKATSIEIAIWNELAKRNIKFEKNKPILKITRPDAFIKPNIAVYADGDYWHNLPNYIERDTRQNKVLLENGYKVFRFWQHEIKKDVKACVDQIEAHINEQNI